MKAFLDTNILLDIMMESRGNHIDSTTLLRVADAGYMEAVISTQSIIDAYYVLVDVSKTPRHEFMTSLNEIMNAVIIESIGDMDIRTAVNSPDQDFEDASQIECARSSGSDCNISSDRKMKRDSTIKVYTPSEFCNMIFGPWH
jgi:Predicted nucleic-acid-binding protein, contains PIN domain